jgi:hypothetical protein
LPTISNLLSCFGVEEGTLHPAREAVSPDRH